MKRIVLLLACASAVSGCAQPSNPPDIEGLRSQVQGLATKVNGLRAQQDDGLANRVGALENEIWWIKKLDEMQHKASFDPITSEGYQTVDVGLARLAVQVADVQPYADGSRVTLTVGNPTSAMFNGLAAEFKYGSSSSDIPAKISYKAWESSMRTQKVALVQAISPGSWTRLTLTLPGVRPEQLGHLELSLSSDQIQLYKAR